MTTPGPFGPPYPVLPPRRRSVADVIATTIIGMFALLVAAGAFFSSMFLAMAADVCSGECRQGWRLNLAYLIAWGDLGAAVLIGAAGIGSAARRGRPMWIWPTMSIALTVGTAFLAGSLANSLIAVQR